MARPTFNFRTVSTSYGPAIVAAFEIHGGVTTPEEFSEAVEEVKAGFVPPEGHGLVVDGRGPGGGYGMCLLEGHPSSWSATRDPRLGVVVVSTHCPSVKRGMVVEYPAA